MVLAGPITPTDILNSTTLVVTALIAMLGSTAIQVYDRVTGRRSLGVQWEERADELSDQLTASYLERIREKARDLERITAERDYWRDRAMGRLGEHD